METVSVAVILGLVMLAREWKMAQEREAWAAERRELLQRIQAPERAVVDYTTVPDDKLTFHIPFDDDEEAFRARERMNLNGDS
jgi:hypothetical protein